MSRDLPTPPSSADDGGAGPRGDTGSRVLRLVARGLEIWLRQQCDTIGHLEIQLLGSTGALLRGRLEGVTLTARRVVFRQLEFEEVELRSEPIRVRLGPLLRSQGLQLENPFQIRGQVAFSSDGLNRSIGASDWRTLGDALAEQLLGLTPLRRLEIEGERLVLYASAVAEEEPIRIETEVSAAAGTVEVRGRDGGPTARLPMDPNVSIERAELGNGLLQLEGEARVSP
ncbi:MAG: DUF2993 domain-containing protein [Cyanobacteriota bacterium]|nr:DUF2993 domain-containing protein [Cyanobacteriota bacterium]